MKHPRAVRIPRVIYFSTAGLLTGVSVWLQCAAVAIVVAHPVVSFGTLAVTMAVVFANVEND